MDFFGNYSIQASSSDTHFDNGFDNDLLSPGSTGTTMPYSCSVLANMSDLSRHFSLQSLEPPSPRLDQDTANTTFQTTQRLGVPEPLRRPSSPSSIPCWKRRMDRQRDVRLLTDQSHLRDIACLVDRMVTSGSQCTINTTFDLSPREDEDDSSPRSSSSSSSSSMGNYFAESRHRQRTTSPSTTGKHSNQLKVQKRRAVSRGGRR